EAVQGQRARRQDRLRATQRECVAGTTRFMSAASVLRRQPEALPAEARPGILIVDDDPAFRRLCKEYLREHPSMAAYEVTEAGTAADALALCRTTKFDCVLLDYRLPDASGTMLLGELRACCGSLTPMILLTGLGSEDVVIEAMHAGAADYIPKDRANE